jgi:hypothetical protein
MRSYEVDEILKSFSWANYIYVSYADKDKVRSYLFNHQSIDIKCHFDIICGDSDADGEVTGVKMSFTFESYTHDGYELKTHVIERIDFFDGDMEAFHRMIRQVKMEEKLAR